MVKTDCKYYFKGSGVRNSNSLPRMRLNAVRAIRANPHLYNPMNIYTDEYTSGIYPVNIVRMTHDGQIVCYDKERKVHGIAKDGTLTEVWKGAFFSDIYKGVRYRWLSAITLTLAGSTTRTVSTRPGRHAWSF